MKCLCNAQALIAAVILPLALSSCVLSNSDPNFAALANTAEANPSPTAIVGMWHRRDTRAMPGGSTMSFLFQSDGTMISQGRSKLAGADMGRTVETHRYYYAGGGIWLMADDRGKFALSQGHLLFVYPIPEYYDEIRFVFDRKE